VILYHAQLSIAGVGFGGGYVGVDVFFVISGYLISKIILADLRQARRFSYVAFYERRVRRIFPALFVVIAATVPFSWRYLLPEDFVEYSNSAISSLLFFSNYYFHFNTMAYGADPSLLKPLLHTWSLSVEEQFYLVLPALLVVCYRKLAGKTALVFLALFVASLVVTEWGSRHDASLNFYNLSSRGWELLAGAFLALHELHGRKPGNATLRHLGPPVGMALILGAVLLFDERTRHPSLVTMAPVLGTVLIMFFGGSGDVVSRILSSKPLVGIGLISYSLYLWHFPIFAFARIREATVELHQSYALIALTFALAVASYFVVERPCRNRRLLSRRTVFAGAAAGFLGLMAFNGTALLQDGFISRLPPLLSNFNYRSQTFVPLEQDGTKCFQRDDDFCEFAASGAGNSIFLIGDSHVEILSRELYRRIEGRYNFFPILKGACFFLPGFDLVREDGAVRDHCDAARQERVLARVLRHPGATVIFGGSAQYFRPGAASFRAVGGLSDPKQGLVELARDLTARGYSIVFIYPMPESRVDVRRTLIAESRKDDPLQFKRFLEETPMTIDLAAYRRASAATFDAYDAVQGGNVYRVYPHELFCDTEIAGQCLTHTAEDIYYYDTDHPSPKAAEMIIDKVMEKVRQIERAAGR
jgi:peptidoglycan/LPS O-acetylase OafA/YrhL